MKVATTSLIFLCLLLTITTQLLGQNTSAIVDYESDNQGVLIPRMTPNQWVSIANPAEGLMVYDSVNHNFYFFNGDNWQTFNTGPKGDTGTSVSTITSTDNGNGTFKITFAMSNGTMQEITSPVLTGPKGDTGAKGDTGLTGMNGTDGAKGDKGDTGAAGMNGTNGTDGAKGDTGAVGMNGTNGIDGAKGDTGDAGMNGTNGIDGAKGDTGAAGMNGTDGMDGAKGDTGATGAPGMNGADGMDGAKGDTGATGAPGMNGTDGMDGVKGDTGATGTPGTNGANGMDGTNGKTILNGITNPINLLGAEGDFYLNTVTDTLFGPKTSTSWPTPGTSLVGPKGDFPDLKEPLMIADDSLRLNIKAPLLVVNDSLTIDTAGVTQNQTLIFNGDNWVAGDVQYQSFLTGSQQSFSIRDPYLAINHIIALIGTFPSRSVSDPFIASVVLFAGNFAPRGWAFCEGQLLPISSNQALFSLIGTIYGGDGRTTLALPDLRGRSAIGPGNGPGLSSFREGQRGGRENVTLTIAQLPSHNHIITKR